MKTAKKEADICLTFSVILWYAGGNPYPVRM